LTNKSLVHLVREIADSLQDDRAACILWRAAKMLELLYIETGIEEKPETLQEARTCGERRLLLKTLFQTKGNYSWAADKLKISRTALYKALMKHDLYRTRPSNSSLVSK
jgi:DNA-binding NtrC family response regulator